MKHCKRVNCIYRAPKGAPNGCDYITVTGKSRIKGVPPERQDPAYCTHYVPSRHKGHPAFSDSPSRPIKDELRKFDRCVFDWDLALKMEQENASRREIALALGCTVDAVAAWRKRRKRKEKNHDESC